MLTQSISATSDATGRNRSLQDNPRDNPWQSATQALGPRVRRYWWLIVVVSLGMTAAGMLARVLFAPAYKATVQVLIDPRGLRIFANDFSPGQLDANAAINYVESQMGVIKSERVLLSVLRDISPDNAPASDQREENRALVGLQRAISVQRVERSFIVDVTVADASPERAARVANAVVKAYIDEDMIDRTAAGKRLTGELSGRLESLRQNLQNAENKAEAFRVKNGLVGVRDKLVVEQRLTEATTALTLAESREAQARGRAAQLGTVPSPVSTIGALGTDPESRKLGLLLDSQSAARNDLEQLTGTLGEQHPSIVNARARLRDIDRNIGLAIVGMRNAAKSQLEQSQTESSILAKKVAALSTELSQARQAEVGLRTLQSDVDQNRKILESFETRSREASEFGQIDSNNLRIVSEARAPTQRSLLMGMLLWGGTGGLGGLALSLGFITLGGFFERTPRAMTLASPQMSTVGEGAANDLGSPAPSNGTSSAGSDADFLLRIKQLFNDCLIAQKPRRDDQPISILITSAARNDDTTFVALNLARVAVTAGLRTILIDANPSRPSLAALVPHAKPANLIKLTDSVKPVYQIDGKSKPLSVVPILSNEQDICLHLALDGNTSRKLLVLTDFEFAVTIGPLADDTGRPGRGADHVVLVGDRQVSDSSDRGVNWIIAPADKVFAPAKDTIWSRRSALSSR